MPSPKHQQENNSPIAMLFKQLSQHANAGKAPARDIGSEKPADAKHPCSGGAPSPFDVYALRKQLEEAQNKIAQMDQDLSHQQAQNKILQMGQDQQAQDRVLQQRALLGLDNAPSRRSSARASPPGYNESLESGPGPAFTDSQWFKYPHYAERVNIRSADTGSSEDTFQPSIGDATERSSATSVAASNGLGWNLPTTGWHVRQPIAPQPQRPLGGRLDTFNSGNGNAFPPVVASRRQQYPGNWPGYPVSVPASSTSVSPVPFGHGESGTPYAFPSANLAEPPRGSSFANNSPWNPTVSLTVPRAALSVMLTRGKATSQLNPTAQQYVPPVEPINYRRLLDRNMSCNWKYIVDKIICNNDQQASIFLQQKLKISTPEQKFELVEAIIAQAYALMINRFGNFLIQRCFEHGTPEQVIAIANSIRGKTLDLSMDAFGCHVIQKAFDVVPEDYKALMVHELLRRIPETVVHRYACHVWQKLFELRWSGSPPQIMSHVNEALQGMWHEVALGETGSLVVQNIFENCLEEDKRPCINEVLLNIDIVSHGQFGNWCIQHICEHGAPPDKRHATDHVLRYATEYSTDQFASKVVEKCLKVGGNDFLGRYLDRVCEGRADRPRMPLIDIAGDQYGNYLIQYILVNADASQRELVAQHVRKHMVSLRGSKFGSRVAMLCTNPAIQTRPGPPTTVPVNSGPYYSSLSHGSQGGYGGSRMGYGLGRPDFR